MVLLDRVIRVICLSFMIPGALVVIRDVPEARIRFLRVDAGTRVPDRVREIDGARTPAALSQFDTEIPNKENGWVNMH